MRLREDVESLQQAEQVPSGYATAEWNETLRTVAALDLSAVRQILGRSYQTISDKPGLREIFVRSSVDGTMQPAALYIPAVSKQPQALAILLHGRPQTEAEILGAPFFRRLADRTGTIIIAPYGRARYDFAEPAASDVYDALGVARASLRIDPRRIYLVGYSMGGFSVFKIGPRQGAPWAGVMCISGAVLNSEMAAVRFAWKGTPVYVVTGAHDDEIPTKYGEETALALQQDGLPVSFYEEPSGSHWVRTLMPALGAAWDDMHGGVVRGVRLTDAVRVGLPSNAPTKPFKP
jgi:poly(3-hydroxybutyrate) depolymerase